MGPPTAAQRVENLEEQLQSLQSTLRETVAAEVSAAIKAGMAAMEQSLTGRFVKSFEETFQRQEAQIDETTARLEGRINRTREHHEALIGMLKDDQVKFQAEMRVKMRDLISKHTQMPHSSAEQPHPGVVSQFERFGDMGESSHHGKGVGFGDGSHGGRGSGGGPGVGSNFSGQNTNWRFKKLDMPLFDGVNPDGWILRAERYHQFYRLSEEDKLEAAIVALEGDALLWFQWENRWRPIQNWEEMKTMVRRQFRSTATGTLQEQWLAHKQTGSVGDYRRKFIELLAPLDRVPEEIAKGQFLNGLKDEVRVEVRLLGPKNLDQAMDLAMMVEDKLRIGGQKRDTTRAWAMASSKSSFSQLAPSQSFKTTNSTYSTGSVSPRVPGSSGASIGGSGEVRRLSDKELQLKREKGLCYRCDDKWSLGHRYKRKELSVLLTADTEDDETDHGIPSPSSEEPSEVCPNSPQPEISLNSVMGLTSPRTLKLRGQIGSSEVVIMVDPGATHNFISKEAVNKLGIPVLPSKDFGVSLGTGDSVQGSGLCKSVVVEVQGLVIVEDFLPLDLGNSDVILGIQWLEKLGTMTTNWKTQTIRFQLGGDSVTLRGDPSLGRSGISLKAMIHNLRKEKQGYLVEFNFLATGEIMGESQEVVCPSFLQATLVQYKRIFDWPNELPPKRSHDHAIVLKEGTDPINVRPYRYPQVQKNEIEKLVNDMLKAGIIQLSSSPFSSPVLLVKKKDGSWRFCVDYRALNKVIVPDKFPIPVIDELLDELKGAVIFTKLDLKSGYHQVRMREEDIPKTAFRTHEGHYEFRVLPFGVTNGPATFQAIMNDVFRPFLRKFVLVFFDDILIYSHSSEEHIEHVGSVFQVLQQHQLYVNKKKCVFGQDKVAYLGHVISAAGVSVDEEKIHSMQAWPLPTSLKELRGFLGLTGYYRKFIRNYAHIAAPLTDQLKKDNYHWTDQATTAFQTLKRAMMEAPILVLPDFEQQFVVETDASGFGVGAVLLQNNHPIAYFSKLLGPRNRLKSIYEKELMAIVFAVQKWRHYLMGRKFVVRTDQQSLRFLFEQREVGGEYQRWVFKLMGFSFDIHYKSGASNRIADALSREFVAQTELGALVTACGVNWVTLLPQIQADQFIQQLQMDIKEGRPVPKGYSVDHDILKYKGRIVIPAQSTLVQQLLEE
ncbi:uncharacterized protein LOC135152878, partial [Daucus carota subsp. sativus]|uniref:uncharacterized protein LOC135152878 n=1 Tax=Daucus carota subsp. sativus TaxID=79200 RepID=UPI00308276CA